MVSEALSPTADGILSFFSESKDKDIYAAAIGALPKGSFLSKMMTSTLGLAVNPKRKAPVSETPAKAKKSKQN